MCKFVSQNAICLSYWKQVFTLPAERGRVLYCLSFFFFLLLLSVNIAISPTAYMV